MDPTDSLWRHFKSSKQCSPSQLENSRAWPHYTSSLHSALLPIDARIKYRVSSQCFSAITSTGLVYLSDLHKIYMPSGQHWSSTDTDSHTLCVSSVNTKSYGECLTLEHTSKRHQIFSISFFLQISTQNENSPADLYLHKTLLIIIIYIHVYMYSSFICSMLHCVHWDSTDY